MSRGERRPGSGHLKEHRSPSTSLLASFSSFRVPGAGVVLFVLTLIGLGASFMGTGFDTSESVEQQDLRRRRLTWLAAGVALLGLGLNEVVVARFVTADGVLDNLQHLDDSDRRSLLAVRRAAADPLPRHRDRRCDSSAADPVRSLPSIRGCRPSS